MAEDKIPYYPSQRYVDKKLAPEKMDRRSVIALANAAKLAAREGILSGGVVDLMLPNLMVEGRADDYGVNKVELNRKTANKILPKLGINLSADKRSIEDKSGRAVAVDNAQFPAWKKIFGDTVSLSPMGKDFGGATAATLPSNSELEYNAKIAVAALKEKSDMATRTKGASASSLDVIQLWNGKGPDSVRHRERVKEADRLLRTDPMNEEIRKLWDSVLEVLPNKPVNVKDSNAVSTILQTLISDYDTNK